MTEYTEKRHEDLAILEAIMHSHPVYKAKASKSLLDMFAKYAPAVFIDALEEAIWIVEFALEQEAIAENEECTRREAANFRSFSRKLMAQGDAAVTRQLKLIESYMERLIH